MAITSLGFVYGDETSVPDMAALDRDLAQSVNSYLVDNMTTRAARVRARSTSFNMPPSTEIPIGAYDVGDLLNTGDIAYGAGIFTVNTEGLYMWSGTFSFSASSDDNTRRGSLYVWQNGSQAPYLAGHVDILLSQSYFTHVSTSGLVVAAAGDTFQMVAYHTNTVYLNGCKPQTFGLVKVSSQ